MSKPSHLLQLTPQFWFPKALALEPPNNPVESGALPDAAAAKSQLPEEMQPGSDAWPMEDLHWPSFIGVAMGS